MDANNEKHLVEVWQKINKLDLSLVVKKMVCHRGWRLKHAREAAKQYRRLLFVWYKYKDDYPELPPSQDIDEFWHNHILATRDYQRDCQIIFGEYLHHNPYTGSLMGEPPMAKAFGQTQRLYHQEFGEYIYEIRPLYWQRWQQKLTRFGKKLMKPFSKVYHWWNPKWHSTSTDWSDTTVN